MSINQKYLEDYKSYISKKNPRESESGVELKKGKLNSNLFPFQKRIVEMAIEKGRYCVFAETGLGKTIMFGAICEYLSKLGYRCLILSQLEICYEIIEQFEVFGINAKLQKEYNSDSMIDVTNYENLHNIDSSQYQVVVLDEASILKNIQGKTFQACCEKFQKYKFKYCFTATPSPNEFLELCNYAEFLEIQRASDILSTYFTLDRSNIGKWQLKGHVRAKRFKDFLDTWSVFCSKPSDVDKKFVCDDIKYQLPELKTIYLDITHKSNFRLHDDMLVDVGGKLGFSDIRTIRRETKIERGHEIVELIKNSNKKQFIVWVEMNAEAELIEKELKDCGVSCVDIAGKTEPEKRRKHYLDFKDGNTQVLITKPKIMGMGINMQHCSNMVFFGMSYSFEQIYQTIRRCYRFKQSEIVHVYMLFHQIEQPVRKALEDKGIIHQKLYKEQ